MLNQLVESKNNRRENARRSEFFLTALCVLLTVLAGSWTYSLYAKDYAMTGGELDVTSLVAPVAVEPATPPAPEPQMKPERAQSSKSDKIVLRDLYDDLDRSTTTPPKNQVGEREVVSARPYDLRNVVTGATNVIPANGGGRGENSAAGSGCGLGCENTARVEDAKEKDDVPQVVVKPTPAATPKAAPTRSFGVVNSIATNLVKPAYPAPARAVRAEGAVSVQVTIDETGSVVSASVVSGHPLLRQAALQAAKSSKFTPTYLSKQPVKVTGVIVYNFKAQ